MNTKSEKSPLLSRYDGAPKAQNNLVANFESISWRPGVLAANL
jgi:hypothetical protein